MKYLLIILTLLSTTLLAAEEDWTILIYMAADNGLTESARSDIDEMERADIPDNMNVIVQADFAGYDFGDDRAFRYKITHDEEDGINSPILKSMGEIDSGDWRTLESFMKWGFSRYPSDRKAVFIWSHGEGWDELDYYKSKYICPDDDSDSKFYVSKGDLRRAFEDISKLDLLVLDACNMQTVEVITEVYKEADYIVGSVHDVPVDGMPYDELFNSWCETSFEEFVLTIPDVYVNSYLPGGSQNPNTFTPNVTCSVVSSESFGAETGLLKSIKEFVDSEHIDTDELIEIRETLDEFNTRAMDVDVKEFAMTLDELGYSDLLDSVNSAFVSYSSTFTNPDVGTAIIWFPDYKSYFQNSYGRYVNLQFEQYTGWGKILNKYYAPDYMTVRDPIPNVKTNSSNLKVSWDRVAYPNKLLYRAEVYSSDHTLLSIFETEDLEFSMRVTGTGYFILKSVIPELDLETVGVKESYALSGAYVFPNPVKSLHRSKLRLYLIEAVDRVQIEIFDIAGNKISSKTIGNLMSGETIIRLEDLTKSALSTGNYFLTIRGEGVFERVKLSFVK